MMHVEIWLANAASSNSKNCWKNGFEGESIAIRLTHSKENYHVIGCIFMCVYLLSSNEIWSCNENYRISSLKRLTNISMHVKPGEDFPLIYYSYILVFIFCIRIEYIIEDNEYK